MPTRVSSARWEGDLRSGSGTVATGSGTFQGKYSFPSRFESGDGTNPEELVAAAHAACYSMALSNALGNAGHAPESLQVTAAVTFQLPDGITGSHLLVSAKVPGLSAEEFQKFAEDAKTNCPVSKALAGIPITLEASLA